jgi:tetratricopeptide (TPR) repeat protein
MRRGAGSGIRAACLGARAVCLGALAAAALLSGCGKVVDYARVAEGNRLYSRGDYQGAIVAYRGSDRSAASAPGSPGRAGAQEKAGAPGKAVISAASATIDYDLANVYARLGEYAAATELYAAARRGGGKDIVADSFFNEGVALFERGRYEEAWKAFRSALRLIEPSSRAAAEGRRNLELAWRAWKKSGRSPLKSGVAASSRGAGTEDEGEQRLLRRLETGRWRPGSAPAAAPTSSDY